MRLFAGIFPPSDALEEICKVQERLRAMVHEKARWVPKERMHLTLRFYGNDAELETTREHFRYAVGGIRAFTLRLTEVSGFPSVQKARVLFLSPGHHSELIALAARFDKGSQEEAIPHLTLARLDWRRISVPVVSFEPIMFWVKEVVLVHSILGGRAPRYEVVEVKTLESP